MKTGSNLVGAIVVVLIQAVAVGPGGNVTSQAGRQPATPPDAVQTLMAGSGDYYVGASKPT